MAGGDCRYSVFCLRPVCRNSERSVGGLEEKLWSRGDRHIDGGEGVFSAGVNCEGWAAVGP